jgi:hypothetical protein
LRTTVVWIAAVAFLTVPGLVSWRVPRIARMPLAARVAFAFATGIFAAAILMFAYALIGIHWSRLNVGIPLLLLGALGLKSSRRDSVEPMPAVDRALIAAFFALTIYAIADARATCGDIVFIWGPKAQAFATARTIDLKFLSFPHYYLMHPDYPPLVPLLFAVGTIGAHGFSWWGPVFIALFALAAIIAVLRGFGASSASTTLVTAVMTFAFVSAYLPGGADPFLVLFEAIAIIALTYEPDRSIPIAAIALAAAAFTKVEGLSFAIIVAVAFALAQRKLFRAVALLIPTAILMTSWLGFMARHDLLDQYARARTAIHWELLGHVTQFVVKFSSYRALWLPWIIALVPLVFTRSRRRALFPLLVAAGSIASTIFFYLHNAEPGYWIASSVDRILVTPLMCIAIASAAARDEVEPDRLADAPVLQPA